jgi:hypothetical protein
MARDPSGEEAQSVTAEVEELAQFLLEIYEDSKLDP